MEYGYHRVSQFLKAGISPTTSVQNQTTWVYGLKYHISLPLEKKIHPSDHQQQKDSDFVTQRIKIYISKIWLLTRQLNIIQRIRDL